MSQPQTQNRLQRWAWLFVSTLAFALLLSQSLAQLHAIKHGRLANASQATGANEAVKTQHSNGFLEQLFSSHGSATDCRLYDNLSHGQAMPAVAVVALPVQVPSLAVAVLQGDVIRRWAASFDARGPPVTF